MFNTHSIVTSYIVTSLYVGRQFRKDGETQVHAEVRMMKNNTEN